MEIEIRIDGYRTLNAKMAAEALGISAAELRHATKVLGNVGEGQRNTLYNSADLDRIRDYLGLRLVIDNNR